MAPSPNETHHKDPVKMQKLYDKYPQLLDPKTNACVRHMNAMLMNWTQGPYDLMTMYGPFYLNDLGSYSSCR